jgi:hypothetical protein
VVGSQPEGEGALEPHGLAVLVAEARVIARERRPRLVHKLALGLAFAERAAAPHGVEQLDHLRERAAALRVVALQHLVDDDAEALVNGLLGGDPQDARELVAQRAAAVGLDVRGGQRQADALARQERPERVLLAGDQRLSARAVVAVGVQQRLIERGGLEDLALQRRGGGEQAGVDVRQRVREALPVGTLQQR